MYRFNLRDDELTVFTPKYLLLTEFCKLQANRCRWFCLTWLNVKSYVNYLKVILFVSLASYDEGTTKKPDSSNGHIKLKQALQSVIILLHDYSSRPRGCLGLQYNMKNIYESQRSGL